MRVAIDPNRCQLHGDCVVSLPEVFEMKPDSPATTVKLPEPPEALREALRAAVRNCPAGAIRLHD